MAYASRQATITIGPATDDVQFIVYSTTPAISRSTNFDLTIQAQNKSDLTLKTDYTPSTSVTLSIDSSGDSLSSTTTDNTGWSNGAKTVSNLQVTGGSGATAATITARDTDSYLIVGTYDVALDVATVTCSSGDVNAYEGFATDMDIGTADADASSLYTTLWSDAGTAFRADTNLSTSLAYGYPSHSAVIRTPFNFGWAYSERRTYFDAGCVQYGGYSSHTITSDNRSGAVAARFKVTNNLDSDLNSDTHNFQALFYFSESSSEFASGAALEDMASPHASINFREIALQGTQYVEVPTSVLSAMSGSTLYAWVTIKKLATPTFDSEYQSDNDPTPEGGNPEFKSQAHFTVDAADIEIYK